MIVSFSIIDISLPGNSLGFLKIIRMLRILRPLRFISRNPGMKIIVNSLIESLKEIINVAILIFYIWFFIKNLG
jgi:hypothetical protein